ncbi:hypothetical protein R6Q57_004043 [Mikania cordata]
MDLPNVSEYGRVSVIDIHMHVDIILLIFHRSDLISMAGATVTGTELEEAGPEAQVYHEVRSAIVVVTALHHLLKGDGYHAAEPHLLEAGARMNQGHHLQEGPACQGQGQGQGQGHHPEGHLLRKGLCLMEIVLLILVQKKKMMSVANCDLGVWQYRMIHRLLLFRVCLE